MPGPGQMLRIGPFTGGLNTASDPTAIADAELTVCTNFELDLDGSLISRTPFKESAGHAGWTERILLLGEGVFGGTRYLIGSNTNGVYYRTGGVWTLITSTFQAGAAVQYSNFMYLVAIPGSANPGGKWSPSGGFTAIASMPKGLACTIHKERLFIVPGISATVNESRLIFSAAGNFDSWTGTDFIDISPGDGTNLIDVTTFNDNLLLFKQDSTYHLSYDIKPSEANKIEISQTIGVTKQHCMANYENQVFVFHNGWVYEMNNLDFQRLNTKIPFIRDPTAPSAFASQDTFISLLEDRLVCRILRNVYVYNLRTRTWSQWESEADQLHYFGPIVTQRPSTGNEYYAGACLTANESIIQFFDKSTATSFEQIIGPTTKTITCKARTKNFDMAIPHQFKRLWWWGADVASADAIVGIATPIVLSFEVTWGQLEAASKKWNELSTWGQPLTEIASITTNVATGTGTARRATKFLKGLRYRQINFEVRLTTDGSTGDGPARIFSMAAVTESRQVVPKAVN